MSLSRLFIPFPADSTIVTGFVNVLRGLVSPFSSSVAHVHKHLLFLKSWNAGTLEPLKKLEILDMP